ncbi:MAG TPA: molybdopterin molybdotransferase MoeA [Candidatus Corynebacterium avicola]|uniref:Molybdopterin molybdenumtransferase n=1 Tax=Candidatus Corynebacterium avicola TaxID=2838527 RepID=A0A9D1UK84_9CORY|nr:molybdopterin molybdotransferase MoeA [Candidatus Corynebacterium avicola]
MTIHAIILAGGAGSRLAESAPADTPAKPLLAGRDGVRLIDRVLDAAAASAAQDAASTGVRVVVAGEMDLPEDVVRLREDPPLSGPAAAVATGARALAAREDTADEDLILLLAADLLDPAPGIAALVAGFREAADDTAGVIGTVAGRRQPLMSVVTLGALSEAVGEDSFADAPMMRLLHRIPMAEVELPEVAAADVDTWDDWTEHLSHQPVTWQDARSRIADTVAAIVARTGRNEEDNGASHTPAPGDVLAQDVLSPIPVPHYTSSAMDGFAVSGAGPWTLLASTPTNARGRNLHSTGGTLEPGQALPILTGSLIPEGTTAVVRSENAEITDDTLQAETPEDGRDIRPSGQEWEAGAVLVSAGTRLTPRHVAMLSACGVDTVEVRQAPSVACAFTGNEVIDDGVPGPGEVRDAFSASFPALLSGWGAEVTVADRLPDDPVAVEDWLRRPDVQAADIVVMTGGSGRSTQDFARRFISRVAEEVLAEEVACQPGHPTLITRRADQLIIGVPGNPFAAHVALHSFIAPAVAMFCGTASDDAARAAVALHPATVAESGHVGALHRDRVRLMPATLGENDGQTTVSPVPGSHSHMLSGYAAADVLIIVPREGVDPGDRVQYLPL